MKNCKAAVRTKNPKTGKRGVVGFATYQKFDTLAEAVQTLGEANVLNLANVQNATTAKNKVRAAATGSVPRKDLVNKAFERITMDRAPGGLLEQYQKTIGNPLDSEKFLDQICAQIKAEKELEREKMMEEFRKEHPESEDEDDDENDEEEEEVK